MPAPLTKAAQARQLALSLDHDESFARDDFVAGTSNRAALSLIESWPDWPNKTMALVGPQDCGKSHLAAIWAGASGARTLSARLLGRVDLPSALATGALVLEDASAGKIDETALFHLLNLAREQGAFLIVTARSAPAAWPIATRDLASRLRAVPVVEVTAPDDALLRALVVKLAADRQLAFDDALVSYVVTHIERSFTGARMAVDTLDRAAMAQKRPVTRALAAELWRDSPAA